MQLAQSRWVLPAPPQQHLVSQLVDALKIPEPLAALLVQRGYDSVATAKAYLRPSLDTLADPHGLKGMTQAVQLIHDAVRSGTRILVHGDYDVDGQCATTLLTRLLREAGAAVIPFVPHRVRDGYDFGPAGLAEAIEHDVGLVITCDCGTTAVDAVTAARDRGLTVIVTDHHLAPEMAPADALINPQQPGCEFPHKELCGTGVAFKLAQALAPALGLSEHLPMHMLDLVALATVADVVPLVGENRTLVRFGLKLLGESRWPGIRALLNVTQLHSRPIRAGQVGFILAPRLNAGGRIGSAMDGVRLLLTDDSDEAYRLAIQLDTLNARRQEMDRMILEQALDVVARQVDLEHEYGLVLAHDDWHPGVVGLVASRVVERLSRPTILVALDGSEGTGSGRSISAFDLHAGLTTCADHLLRFGGHRMAAGLTIRRDRLDGFREAFNAAARAVLTADDLVPRQRIDLIVPVGSLNDEFENLLRHFEPCGQGNPGPIVGIRSARVRNAMTVGTNHLRFTLFDDTGSLEAIAFTWADRVSDNWWEAPWDIALRLERNEFRGVSSLQARVVQITPVG